MGTVYLIHFDRAYKHAKHYMGFTRKRDVELRMNDHRNGNGANLLRVLKEAGIGWTLARVWKNKSRKFERQLKNRKNAHRECPICSSQAKAAASSPPGSLKSSATASAAPATSAIEQAGACPVLASSRPNERPAEASPGGGLKADHVPADDGGHDQALDSTTRT